MDPPPHPTFKLITTALVLIVLLNLAVIWEVLSQENTQLYHEGQFIETLTASSFLCGAVVLFAASFFKQNLSRFLSISLANINLIAFLREVDVADYNVPSPLRELASNNLKDGIFTVVVFALILFALKNYRHELKKIAHFLRSPVGLLFATGGILFLVACIAELSQNKFLEELLEANAAMTFLCGSLLLSQKEPEALTER